MLCALSHPEYFLELYFVVSSDEREFQKLAIQYIHLHLRELSHNNVPDLFFEILVRIWGISTYMFLRNFRFIALL